MAQGDTDESQVKASARSIAVGVHGVISIVVVVRVDYKRTL
jgi:hypothetical protein